MKQSQNYTEHLPNEVVLFVEKRRNSQYKLRFIKVLEYIVFCYTQQLKDKIASPYSKSYCLDDKNTNYGNRFEEYLTENLIEYLQRQDNKNTLDLGNEDIDFEVRDDVKNPFSIEDKSSNQYIDIAFTGIVTKLERREDFNGKSREKIYFAFEAKRINTMRFDKQVVESNISEYLKEINKFLENRIYEHRFSFEGMIGYIENSQKGIDKIIKQIDNKLDKNTTIQNLQEFNLPNTDFEYCYLSRHKKQDIEKTEKEIYHLFLDYTQIIVA